MLSSFNYTYFTYRVILCHWEQLHPRGPTD